MKVKTKTYLAAALAGLIGMASVPGSSQAADAASEKAKIPTFGEVLDASGISIGGYVDTSYTYNGNGVATTRVFDVEPNSFNLQMVELAISKQPDEGFGGTVVLNAGSDANVINAFNGAANDYFDVQQAFASYKTGGAHLMLGKFATLIGAEVIESPANWNFSRSILFGFAIPFTHTGLRLHYETGGSVAFALGVNNGWDNVTASIDAKSFEAAVTFSPSDEVFLSIQGMYGKEATVGINNASRSVIDLVASWEVVDGFTLMANLDYGTQKEAGGAGTPTATWKGVAAYVNYDINDMWRTTVRGEYFDDADGFRTGTTQKIKEVTFTLAYMASEHAEIRGELRRDWSDVASFATDTGPNKDSQNTAAVEAIYKF